MKNKDGKYLNIVNENDEIIDEDLRTEIHEKGLLHREAHVWFVNKNGIFFQHRAKDEDSYPDLLDATVGGHVEKGDSYLETAIKESEEETGIKVEEKDLTKIKKFRKEFFDDKTKTHNNTFREVFAYFFEGKIEDLKIEIGKSQGFKFLSWDKIEEENEITKKIIPVFYDELLEMYKNGDFDKIIK